MTCTLLLPYPHRELPAEVVHLEPLVSHKSLLAHTARERKQLGHVLQFQERPVTRPVYQHVGKDQKPRKLVIQFDGLCNHVVPPPHAPDNAELIERCHNLFGALQDGHALARRLNALIVPA